MWRVVHNNTHKTGVRRFGSGFMNDLNPLKGEAFRESHIAMKTCLLAPIVHRKILQGGLTKPVSTAKDRKMIAPRVTTQTGKVKSLLGLTQDSIVGFSDIQEMDKLVKRALITIIQRSSERMEETPKSKSKSKEKNIPFDSVRAVCQEIAFSEFDASDSYLNRQDKVSRCMETYAAEMNLGPEEMKEIEPLIALEINLEHRVLGDAVDRHRRVQEDLQSIGRLSATNRNANLLVKWVKPMADEIEKIQKNMVGKKGMGPNGFQTVSHFWYLLDAETMAVVAIYETINRLLSSPAGSTYTKLCVDVGRAVEQEVKYRVMSEEKQYHKKMSDEHWVYKESPVHMSKMLSARARKAMSDEEEWSMMSRVHLGACLLSQLIDIANLPEKHGGGEAFDTLKEDGEKMLIHERNEHQMNAPGRVRLSQAAFEALSGLNRNIFTSSMGNLPMVIPPRPWTSLKVGGYFHLRSSLLRFRTYSPTHVEALKRADLSQVYQVLTDLGEVPWRINQRLLDIVSETWYERKISIGSIPQMQDMEVVTLPENIHDLPIDQRRTLWRDFNKGQKQNSELYSLRCDLKYKLDVADEFREIEFFFPYNLDFRGRAYPIPPHLNHIGNDICRSLLTFSEKKRLGERGLWWLKVHLCNLSGNNKIPTQERAEWTDANKQRIIENANNPLDGDRWWAEADDPWQFLATCIELSEAWKLDDPAEYECSLPVHQDGSCNGLQHYAALSRDRAGAQSVNLSPSDRPQDVYTGVLNIVNQRIDQDVQDGVEMAKLLQGKLTRKVVKQTVMTSVYGVTFIGARSQILKQLDDLPDVEWPGSSDFDKEKYQYHASVYLAKHTISSIGDLFRNANEVMEWLSNTARKISKMGQPMFWITPMGLPIVQPYRNKLSHEIRTAKQSVLLQEETEDLPVDTRKQTSAFPPNYVHSLDSTHMMKTARKCTESGITFAAVHDSYWTHACDVDEMNRHLREQFIDLHSQPLLQQLKEGLEQTFPQVELDPVPELGDFKLEEIADSEYFFN